MDKFANVISDMTIRLRDGRTMGVLTAGDANGFPLFHFTVPEAPGLKFCCWQRMRLSLGYG